MSDTGNRPSEDLVKLSVTTCENRLVSLNIEPIDDDVGSANDPSADDATEEASDVATSAQERFLRKSCSPDELCHELRKLSLDWTRLSLVFFEIVPELTAANFSSAEELVVKGVVEYAEKVSSETEATKLENGELFSEYIMPDKHIDVLLKKLGKSSHSIQAAALMSQATLGALISEYELFVTNMLRAIARFRPRAFIQDDHKISVKDLEEYGSFDEFLNDEIDSSISALMLENSHIKMLKWIEKRFSVNLTSNKELVAGFVEICQRRHLIAHAGGRVNKRYLDICTEAGVPEESLPKLGDTLTVGRSYIRKATARIYQMGSFTLHMIWHKLLPDNIDDSHVVMLSASHDFVDCNLTKMARRVIDFALYSKKDMSAATRAAFTINSGLSYLFDDSLDDEKRSRAAERELRQHDWSMTPPLYQLALCCVKRDFSNLNALTLAALDDGLDFAKAMTWVVFREVREMPDFSSHFE